MTPRSQGSVRVFRVAALVAIGALGVELGTPAHAMSYAYRLYGARSIVIDAVGKIESDERSIFVDWWYTLPLDIQNRKTVGWVFNSPGGSVVGAIEIARFIARGHANNGVAANGLCVSACVLAWANGSVKSAAPDSRIGVHNVTINAANPDQQSAANFAANAGDAITAKYLAALGAPASVVGLGRLCQDAKRVQFFGVTRWPTLRRRGRPRFRARSHVCFIVRRIATFRERPRIARVSEFA